MRGDTHNGDEGMEPPLDRQVAAALREIGIPPRPTILEVVAREMRREEPDFRSLAQTIGADVGLAAALLKTVNSPFFGYRTKARTVQDALMMLGLDLAASTIASIVLRRVLPTGPNLERFWDASSRVAQLASWLVGELGVKDGVRREDAYTYALFRDCGIPILMRKLPDYAQTLARANAELVRSFTEVEEDAHPTNHAIVGALLAQSWWLPEDTCLAIRQHHAAEALAPTAVGPTRASQRLVALAQLAEYAMQRLTGLNRTMEWEKLGPSCLAVLALPEADLEDLLAPAGRFLESCPLWD